MGEYGGPASVGMVVVMRLSPWYSVMVGMSNLIYPSAVSITVPLLIDLS